MSPYVTILCNSIVHNKGPPTKLLHIIIITILKPRKPGDNPANCRPISLLNNDIHFFLKILANRINEVLPDLISVDQVGSVKDIQARDGPHRVLDLISLAKNLSLESVLISLNAKKAFNRIGWQFGSSGFIANAVNSLYTYPSASVLTSVFLLAPFQIYNKNKTGLSPYLSSYLFYARNP